MKQKLCILILFLSISFSAPGQRVNIARDSSAHLIFAGDYPDPSILVDGSDYYIVHSSFDYYPGLLIWHSKDLVNWKPLVNALHTYVGSVWAPDLLRYKDKYYIYFPANQTNYVITADQIGGPWSEPVDLKIGNIDPGHVADSEGRRYLYFSNGGYVRLADDGLSVMGELQHSYDGWAIPKSWSIECFCMEGPKIVKHGEYYYLTVAEGGTAGPATGHMVISARSRSPLGPWENSPYNPVIRAKSASERWWSKGHATPFKDIAGNWWIVFHAYENGFYNMGRQTLLQAMEWTPDGWFRTKSPLKADEKLIRQSVAAPTTAFTWSDPFNERKLKPQWKFFGAYDTARFVMTGSGIKIRGKGSSVGNSAPLLTIPSDHSYSVQVELEIEGEGTGGLVLFYNQTAYSGILADKENILTNLRGWQFITEEKAIKRHTFLRLENLNHTVNMFYSRDGKNWMKTENSAEVSALHHNVLGGFLSLRIGLCAMGEGSVKFRNFTYQAIN
ncbi:family 43 glycosylhydrolase [Pedobacter sp. AW31-3R]|uniref:family 43 glycosylhydrolase n=1 Tax=Pedobacter sp. AW31-3R TaxID=3445781 RepID=UPI003F9F946F